MEAGSVSLFFATFLLIYGSTHAYAFVKAKAALGFGAGTALWVVPLLALLICAPFVTHLLERNGMEAAAAFPHTSATPGWGSSSSLFPSTCCRIS